MSINAHFDKNGLHKIWLLDMQKWEKEKSHK